jgi:hypothetical protein
MAEFAVARPTLREAFRVYRCPPLPPGRLGGGWRLASLYEYNKLHI